MTKRRRFQLLMLAGLFFVVSPAVWSGEYTKAVVLMLAFAGGWGGWRAYRRLRHMHDGKTT